MKPRKNLKGVARRGKDQVGHHIAKVGELHLSVWPSNGQEESARRDALLAKLLEECGELSAAIRDMNGRWLRPDKPFSSVLDVENELGDVYVVLCGLAEIAGADFAAGIERSLLKFTQRVEKFTSPVTTPTSPTTRSRGS